MYLLREQDAEVSAAGCAPESHRPGPRRLSAMPAAAACAATKRAEQGFASAQGRKKGLFQN